MNNKPLSNQQTEELRKTFERLANDSFGFRRSRKGNYVNPAVARDWKWFQLGFIHAEVIAEKEQIMTNNTFNPDLPFQTKCGWPARLVGKLQRRGFPLVVAIMNPAFDAEEMHCYALDGKQPMAAVYATGEVVEGQEGVKDGPLSLVNTGEQPKKGSDLALVYAYFTLRQWKIIYKALIELSNDDDLDLKLIDREQIKEAEIGDILYKLPSASGDF